MKVQANKNNVISLAGETPMHLNEASNHKTTQSFYNGHTNHEYIFMNAKILKAFAQINHDLAHSMAIMLLKQQKQEIELALMADHFNVSIFEINRACLELQKVGLVKKHGHNYYLDLPC